MLKLVATSVLTCCGLVCSVCDACDCGNCNCGCPCGAAKAVATAPSMPEMATPAPMANAGQSYRTYSYQPTPNMSYRAYGNRTPAGGFHDASWKIRGN